MLKSQALQILGEKIAVCTKCDCLTNFRHANDYKTVPGVGNSDARVMIIGEAPGENEAKDGIPFCGKAGNLLTNILKAAKLSRDDVFITNTIKCRPPGNRDPEMAEAENCRKFLDMQIKVVNPEWLVCFGRIASVYLLGCDPNTSISSLRGKIHTYQGRKVLCTYHPAYVLHTPEERRQEAKKAIWDDLQPLVGALQSAPQCV